MTLAEIPRPATAQDAGETSVAAVLDRLTTALSEERALRAEDIGGSTFAEFAARFGLSDPEALAVALLAGAELDRDFAALAGGSAEATGLPIGALLARLPALGWDSFLPTAVLRSWALISMAESGRRTDRRAFLDPRCLDWCLGHAGPDAALLPYLRPPGPAAMLTAPAAAEIGPAADRLAEAAETAGRALTLITGSDGPTRQRLASDLAASLGCDTLSIDPGLLRLAPQERQAVLRRLARETVLDRVLPVFDLPRIDAGLGEALARIEGTALLTAPALDAPEALPPGCDQITLAPPGAPERAALWAAALELDDSAALAPLAEAFALGADDIARAATGLAHVPPEARPAAAWAATRRLCAPPPDPLFTAITPRATLADLILPAATEAALRALLAQVRHRATVYRAWGFAARSSRGLGVSALFSGPSGTGKTLAAEAIAGALDLPLLSVNLAQVVDKYVGETEKHLDRVFGRAERAGAVLFFDEAEALFRQRGDGESGAARFTAMTVAYLLQRLEASPATCILATNMRGAIDDAFLRRLRFAVQFAFPGAAERARLWAAAFPEAAPLGEIDIPLLATLPATGGTIRNAALGAGFRAAEAGRAIGLQDIVAALESENAKLAQPVDLGVLRRRVGR
ncbi:ATP-binding protein [Poseidonocella sedimentorum]|uniref:ATPase family associated with various cellular activities (AAA) n=1 Tax=Poseidonocella sedimentorum TaxID=871652 RepID=A0A1I6DP81_9RHOB|nr:ATP-binding protein [Poseidonocella sedimentorum]SFR07226.1 ATPase family associated with various cellular activities (AAA) [Poseidonocella sedimentorum]